MKWRLLLMLLIATGAYAAPGGANNPVEAPPVTGATGRRASDGASAAGAQDGTGAVRKEAVEMEPVLVTSTHAEIVGGSQPKPPNERPFDLKEGGTILKHRGPRFTTELKFQYNPVHRGWDILSISW
jgi:hypothetical protein